MHGIVCSNNSLRWLIITWTDAIPAKVGELELLIEVTCRVSCRRSWCQTPFWASQVTSAPLLETAYLECQHDTCDIYGLFLCLKFWVPKVIFPEYIWIFVCKKYRRKGCFYVLKLIIVVLVSWRRSLIVLNPARGCSSWNLKEKRENVRRKVKKVTNGHKKSRDFRQQESGVLKQRQSITKQTWCFFGKRLPYCMVVWCDNVYCLLFKKLQSF